MNETLAPMADPLHTEPLPSGALQAAPAPQAPPVRDLAPPHRFFWVVLPYAIYIGFTTNGGVSLLLRRAGLPVGEVANAIALLGIPSSIYFLWSPLADMGMPRRLWHLVASLAAAAALVLGSFALYANPRAAVWWYFVGLLFCMLISSSYGGLLAAMLTPASRGRGAAWAQASNLGGGAVGPGIILFLALRYRPAVWIPLSALLLVVPALSVLLLREPERLPSPSLAIHLRRVGGELRSTCVNRDNLLGVLLLLAPPGAGALIGLLPALSPDYRVSGSSVVWINGIGGGALVALGCLFAGWLPRRFDRRVAYGLSGALVALPAFYLAWAPARRGPYIAGTILYLFAIGITCTYSMDLVLDIVGAVGESGSLRYSILSALSYLPIAYMTWLEGVAGSRHGFRAVPAMEAVSALVDLPLLLIWAVWRRGGRPAAPPGPARSA